jgi:hypothetical protein
MSLNRRFLRLSFVISFVAASFATTSDVPTVVASQYCSVELPPIHLTPNSPPVTRANVIDANTCAVTVGPVRLLTSAELSAMGRPPDGGRVTSVFERLDTSGKAGLHAPLLNSGTRTAWADHQTRYVDFSGTGPKTETHHTLNWSWDDMAWTAHGNWIDTWAYVADFAGFHVTFGPYQGVQEDGTWFYETWGYASYDRSCVTGCAHPSSLCNHTLHARVKGYYDGTATFNYTLTGNLCTYTDQYGSHNELYTETSGGYQ